MSIDSFESLFSGSNTSPAGPEDKSKLVRQAARLMYRKLLERLAGSYRKTGYALFHVNATAVREDGIIEDNDYNRFVSTPGVTILKEETTFAQESVKNEEGYFRSGCLQIAVKFVKVDYASIYKNIRIYLDDLKEAKPPLDNTSGLKEIDTAWKLFESDVPLEFLPGYRDVQKQLEDLTKIVVEREKKREKKDQELAKTLAERNSGKSGEEDSGIQADISNTDKIPEILKPVPKKKETDGAKEGTPKKKRTKKKESDSTNSTKEDKS